MKTCLFFVLLASYALNLSAQQKEVGVTHSQQERTTEPTQSVLNVNASPRYYTDVNIEGRFNPVRIHRDGKFYNWGTTTALSVSSLADTRFTCAIEGIVQAADYSDASVTYGVKGVSNGGTLGSRYGIFGSFSGQAGAGIYGTMGNDDGVYLTRPYAGFFNGDTKMLGDLEVSGGIRGAVLGRIRADADEPSFGHANYKLGTLKLVSYRETENMLSSNSSAIASQYASQLHYGLKVQYMPQTIAPLIYTDNNGEQFINYSDLIPLLVQEVNDLRSELVYLQNRVGVQTQRNSAEATEMSLLEEAVVLQNTPNPFNAETQISMMIPQNVQQAVLYVYDLNGRQIKNYTISQRGSVSFALSAMEFEAGIYLYALVVDGKACGTQRMIVTS